MYLLHSFMEGATEVYTSWFKTLNCEIIQAVQP